jgi:hypothetical protein
MPWQVPITVDGLEYPVTFNTETEPTQQDYDEAIQQILQQRGQTAPQQPTGETPGYFSQLGTALGLGYRQMASGVGATFNALTGDTADVAAEMVEMGKLQREQQAAQTPEDVEFMRRLEEAKKAGEEAQGPIEYIGALAQYPAAVLAEPGAAFKTAVQSAPNVIISAGTQLAGRALGGLVGGAGGLELGPGAILTGIAGSIAGGALSNTLMEAGPSIYDVLNERTQGAAANMTADQIATYLKDNPDILDEGLKTGAIRGTVIGAVESLGMKGSGKLMTMPERAAARAVQKKLVDAGVDIASKEAVDKALLDPALRTATRTAAEAAKKQFSSAGNLARLAGGSAIETGAAVGGELAAQAAAGQEIDTTEAFLEGLGEMALSVPISAANKTIEGAKYMLNPALQNPDTQLSAQAAQETINQSELQSADKANAEAARLAADKAAEAAIVPAPAPITLAPAPAPITPASVTEPQAQLPPTMEQAAAPAVGIPPTPTIPTQDATIQGEIPKDSQQERIETDEGGATAETGGGNRPVVGRQVEAQEEVDLKAGLPRQQPGEAPDIITWLKENYARKPIVFVPKAKRRKATAEAEALGILDELPLPVKRRLFSFDYGEGTNVANMDEITGLAYEANLIPSNDPTVLAQSIIEAFKARKAGTSLIKEGEQQMETAEQRTIEFYKSASDRTAPLTLIPRRDLDIGDVVQVGDDKMRVTYEYDEDGYPTALILTGPKFGEQRFDPNKPLKAENTSNASDLKAVNNNTASQDQIDALVNRGFVEIYKGSPVITDVGVEQMPKKPKLTADQRKAQIDAEQVVPTEKAAEVEGVTAPVAEPIVAEKSSPAPLREGAGGPGVVQAEPVEGSIPTVDEVSPETETLSTPQSLAQNKEDAKQQKKDSDENLKALNSLEAGTKTNPVFGTVTREDANEAMRLIEDGKELPNVFFTVVTTREEFLADPRNEQLYPQVWNALKTNKKIEGLFDDATNTPFVFTDGVVVYDLDRKAAQELGISPQVAAVRRVLRHENIHKGMLHLTPSEMVAMRRFLATIFSEEALDNLAKTYTKYANWRSDPRLYFQAIEEIVNQKLDQSTVLPKDGIWGQFFELLTAIWRRITGKRNQPTVKDMKDVMRLVRNGLIRSTKAQADQTKDGGNVLLSVRAYHGTPHKVDKFTTAKIGTGEGAQAYGWGLYFAESERVAKTYQEQLRPRQPDDYDSAFTEAAKSFIASNGKVTLEDLRSAYPKASTAALEWGMREARGQERGNLYTVELLPDADEFLDWDKPLSEQPEKVQQVFFDLLSDLTGKMKAEMEGKEMSQREKAVALGIPRAPVNVQNLIDLWLNDATASGSGLYDLIRGVRGNGATPTDTAKAASEYLASLGIPGIRYADGQSRVSPLEIRARKAEVSARKADVERDPSATNQSALRYAEQALSDLIRKDQEGTRNYVIFDENLVKILEENGQVLTTPTDQTRDGGNVMMSFIGEKAIENLPEERRQFMRDSLDAAKAMAAAGKSSEEIRAATGWFPGLDGKMRWEVPDNDASFIDAKAFREASTKVYGGPAFSHLPWKEVVDRLESGQYLKISDVLNHPLLFEAYPDAANIAFFPISGNIVQGSHRAVNGNSIITATVTLDGDQISDESLSTILHELQHYIQNNEGFAKGGSPDNLLTKADLLDAVKFRQSYQAINKYRQQIAALVDEVRKEKEKTGFLGFGGPNKKAVQSLNDRIEEIQKTVNEIWAAQKKNLSLDKGSVRAALLSAINRVEDRFGTSWFLNKRNEGLDMVYRSLAGEIEARDVQARQSMTDEQRAATAPYSSENIAPEDAIVMFGSGGAQMSMAAPATDAEYLAAVEAGDMEKARRMVDEAAKAAEKKASRAFDVENRTLGARNRGMEGYGVWILPDGRIIPVDNHSVFAKEFFKAKNLDDGVGYAFGRGWRIVRAIKAGQFRWEENMVMTEGGPLNRTQRNNLKDWAVFNSYNTDFDEREQGGLKLPVSVQDNAGNIIPPSQRFQPTSPDIRLSLPIVHSSESEASYANGQMAASMVTFTPRQMYVYSALEGAYNMSRKPGRHSVPLSELYQAALEALPDMTQQEFSEAVQTMYQNNSALLNAGESDFSVVNKDGDRVSSVVLLGKGPMASMIPSNEVPEIASKLASDLKASVTEGEQTPYEGLSFTGVTPKTHARVDYRGVRKSAEDFVNQMIRAQKAKGKSYADALIEIANTITNPSFANEYMADSGTEEKLLATQAVAGPLNAKIYSALLTTKDDVTRIKLNDAYTNVSTYYEGSGTIGGTVMGYRAWESTNGKYGWMLDSWKADALKNAVDAIDSQMGGSVSIQIGESLRRSVEGVSDSTANEVEGQAQEDRDAALFREGQEALSGEDKNTFESIKSFLKIKAIINRRKLIRAGNQAMASIVSDEEYNAIMAMSDEEANALEKEIDAKLSAALKKLNSSLSGREDVKAKVDAAINVATDRANKGEDITFTQVTIEEAMADLFKPGDDTREKIVDNVADALLKRAKQAMAKPSKISSIQQLIASIKRTLLANIKVDKTTDADSLGRMLAMTFAQQVSEARVYASSWSEGRKKVREMLAEIGIEESELDSELNKIMPPTPTLAFSPSAAKRAIALAMEESGVSREDLLDPRPEISKQAKNKLMAHLDKAAANENLTEQGWNKTGNTGRQLAEKAIDEAIAKWRIEQQNRLEISNLVAEQADNPVSMDDFAKKLSRFNLTPKQVKKYFDIASRAAVRSVEMRKDQARRIIYTRGDIRPDALEKEVDGDTVIDAFTDQVSSPTDLKTFVERLDKLGVTFDLAESLFNTAARERRDRQRTRVFDMIEGPRALQKMLDEIRNVRTRLEVPLRSPIPWKELLSKPAKSVAEYRQKVLDAIMANPDLASVDSEVKERLADMFADVWQQQLDKVVNQIIDNYTQQLDRAKRRHAGDVLNKTRLQVIQHLNLNALSNDAFTRILGEKFGIKMELTEAERENIQRLVDILQDETLPKNKRNQAANDLAFALVNDTKVGWSERLSAFWTSSVLAGWNTMIAIGLAFLNGANIIMVNLPMKIMSNLINGDFKGAFYSTFDSLNDIKRYIEAFPEALERSWHYLNTGRVEFLESEASAPDRIFRGWADVLRYRKVAEAMANDPQKVTQWMGKFSVMISRMMTALDGFNTILTKRGMLSMAVRLGTKNPEDHQRILEKASLEHYRQQILASDPYFAQMNSEKRALLNATAEAMMYEAMNKEGAKLENADFFASESAMTMNPTGIGGIVYNKIRSADVEVQEFMRRKLAEQKLKAAVAGPMSLENAKLAGMFVAHFIAYNAINMIGLRFARFASNKFNQGLSFIPFVGILRGWEASNNQLADRKEAFYDMIKRNQMVGMFFVGAGSILLRAIADEPDDEERGFFINGGLKNVPTDKRRQLQESGKLEYRLGAKIGGKWYVWNYQNSPYSQLFAAVGAISDIIRFSPDKWNDKSKLDVALSVAASGLSSTLDLPALQGLGTLMGRSVSSSDPTEQFWENIGATTANWVGGFIPKPFMDVDYILDDNRRKYTTIWEKFAGKVPFYRRYVGEDYYNILGDPIKANTLPGSREFLVGKTEPVYQILGALNSRNIWLTPANAEYRMVGKGRNRRRLTQEEADAYSFETGKGYKAMILRYGPRALQMDPERAKAFLHDKADQIRDRALKKVYRGYRSRTATP